VITVSIKKKRRVLAVSNIDVLKPTGCTDTFKRSKKSQTKNIGKDYSINECSQLIQKIWKAP